MKPQGILFFLILTMLVLASIMIVFPKDGIYLGRDLSLDFPSFFQLTGLDPEAILKGEVVVEGQEERKKTGSERIEVAPDSFITEDQFIAFLEDSIAQARKRIQYPNGDKSVLYPFFAVLDNVYSFDKPVRILHYGDSQLEGDRITSYIRENLQGKFGGSGPGLVPAYQTVPSFTMWQDQSENWQRFSAFGMRGEKLNHSRYGVLCNFTRFAPVPDGSSESNTDHEAWIRLHQTNVSYAKSRNYKYFRIFYGYSTQPVVTKLLADGEFVSIDTLKADSGFHVKTYSFDSPPDELAIFFNGKDSPEFYGISMESAKGLLVDNIALRGSSGTLFTGMDRELMQKTFQQLNVKAFFLQFGGNAVPAIQNMKDVENYGNDFARQIRYLKNLVPGATIIVMGPADMSIKDKTEFVTAPFVEETRDALREATFSAGGVFYDIYEVMGGRNSMPRWVGMDPALAGQDYIHFTPRGAKKIAEHFYSVLMEDYQEYKNNQKAASR